MYSLSLCDRYIPFSHRVNERRDIHMFYFIFLFNIYKNTCIRYKIGILRGRLRRSI